MRRFSQRSALVTLSEINITPLLDLAFVLLIIFVITTPLLEQSINLKLPKGMGQPDKKVDPRNVRTVEISVNGNYDSATHDVVTAFQRHFRPERVDGVADDSTRDTLRDLLAGRDAAPNVATSARRGS